MRTVYGDHERFITTYFTTYPGKYFTGDGCRRDKDGYYWITGRVDDVINVSGHRLGTAEIESALVGHSGVTEAAVSVECLAEDIDLSVVLSKDEFEARVSALVGRLRAPIEQALREAKLTKEQIAEVKKRCMLQTFHVLYFQ